MSSEIPSPNPGRERDQRRNLEAPCNADPDSPFTRSRSSPPSPRRSTLDENEISDTQSLGKKGGLPSGHTRYSKRRSSFECGDRAASNSLLIKSSVPSNPASSSVAASAVITASAYSGVTRLGSFFSSATSSNPLFMMSSARVLHRTPPHSLPPLIALPAWNGVPINLNKKKRKRNGKKRKALTTVDSEEAPIAASSSMGETSTMGGVGGTSENRNTMRQGVGAGDTDRVVKEVVEVSFFFMGHASLARSA
ncbi:hypothetical protein M422DRAFT_243387 [Sphaerobolus stellatus SS14]|nr:hypothetical protein M422DRAFT_243387 [Sphaerobolus stellatus SS14]